MGGYCSIPMKKTAAHHCHEDRGSPRSLFSHNIDMESGHLRSFDLGAVSPLALKNAGNVGNDRSSNMFFFKSDAVQILWKTHHLTIGDA